MEHKIEKTPELKDDPMFKLTYKEMYLRLRRVIEKGQSKNKENLLKELDGAYEEAAKSLNLL